MLKIENLKVGYGRVQVIWGVSFKVNKGETVALVGSNGAGKTTILKTIIGSITPISGIINFLGREVNGIPAHEMVSKGLVYVPEGRKVFPYMTVRENLELGAYTVKNEATVRETSEWLFEIFPKLKERQNQLAGTFSGGEQQMLVIGRALMSNPKLIMIDEPSLGLMPSAVDTVYEVIDKLHKQGVTVLLVEQNISRSLKIAQNAYVLENGKIVLKGDSKSLLNNKDIKKTYLGV